MAFSAGLQLTGLDDFITPSQACIKPVQTPAGTCGPHRPKGPWCKVVIRVLRVEEEVIVLACACMA
jgi:hypothetical protein